MATNAAKNVEDVKIAINQNTEDIKDINRMVHDQLLAVEQIADGMDRISQVVIQNEQVSTENANLSTQVALQADTLIHIVR